MVNLLTFPTVCLCILIKMTRYYKELLSSLQGSVGSNLPYDPSTHKESRVCYFGWTGRCCLYPLVIWCNCWWLGTVSFTINPSFLQLRAPCIQSGSHFVGCPTACSYRWVKGVTSKLQVDTRYPFYHPPWPGCCQVFSSASAQGDSHPAGSS